MKLKSNYIYLYIGIAITAFIFSNSMQTAEQSSQTSQGLLKILLELIGEYAPFLTHNFLRKTAHFIEFSAQSFFLGMFFLKSLTTFLPACVYVMFSGLLTACTDEFIQLFFPGRGGMITDVFIDFSGTLAGLLISIIFIKLLVQKKG